MVSFSWLAVLPVADVSVLIQPILIGVPVGAGWVVPVASPLPVLLLLDEPQAATITSAIAIAIPPMTRREACSLGLLIIFPPGIGRLSGGAAGM
jgi:hypothetical protein